MRNIQAIAIELYKVVHNLSPKMMNQIFVNKKSRYPSKSIFQTNNIRTTKYGPESLKYLGPKIWELIPEEIKKTSHLWSSSKGSYYFYCIFLPRINKVLIIIKSHLYTIIYNLRHHF